jgi:hypothetical protein
MSPASPTPQLFHIPLVTSDLAPISDFFHNYSSTTSSIQMEKGARAGREITRNSLLFYVLTSKLFEINIFSRLPL